MCESGDPFSPAATDGRAEVLNMLEPTAHTHRDRRESGLLLVSSLVWDRTLSCTPELVVARQCNCTQDEYYYTLFNVCLE